MSICTLLALWTLPAAVRQPAPTVTVAVDSAAHTVHLTAGRFMIAGAAADEHAAHRHGGGEPLMRFRWPTDGWIRGVRLAITDGAGRPLPRALVHHINVVHFGRRQLFYPAPERILAMGQETEDITLPKSVGVPVDAGAEMAIVLMWHNPSATMYHDVTVTLTIDWSPTTLVPRPLSVLPVYMNVTDPIASPVDFDLPPGTSAFSADFRMPLSGRIIGAGGHLHDHGTGLTLAELRGAASPRELVALDVEREADGTLRRVSRTYPGISGRGIKLTAGRSYRMTGGYANPTGLTVPSGAMVHLVLLFAPEAMADWPPVDPAEEGFQRDVAWLEGTDR